MITFERFLSRVFPGGPIYARIRRRELWLKNISERTEWREPAAMAIDRAENTIVAAGYQAARPTTTLSSHVEVVWPFDHPRSVIGNYLIAEKLFAHAVHALHAGRWLRSAPVILVHPLESLEGGMTDLEIRALRELVTNSGARKALVWEGRELLDSEVGDVRYTIAV